MFKQRDTPSWADGGLSDMAKPHILVVDDDSSIRSLLFTVLDRSGYRVSAASDGVEALEIVREDCPDVVFVDLRMPRMDGRTFVTEARKLDPDSVLIVLTGHGTVESTVDLMKAGVYSVLTKPHGIDEILVMVEKALRERRLKERSADLERRLEISERLAMIGKLAAGVAHELNSPLDGVIRFVRLTLDSLDPHSEAREYQEEALKGLKRMSAIIRDLLTFSRNIAFEASEENLESILRDAWKQTLANQGSKEVRVAFDLALPDTSVPRGMFQVFQNLLKNALDAVGTGGRIDVVAGVRDGEIYVSVRDDGPGIPPEIRDRVFEPFFTTKDVGKGTGLGLSIVSRIMERFGGGVDIESVPGAGTTVTVYYPAKSDGTRKERHGDEPIEAESLHPAR